MRASSVRNETARYYGIFMNTINWPKQIKMPRPYSEDLRWRAIWMILGFKVDEVASALCMSPRTVECYVAKFQTFGEVKTGTIGRPFNSVSMHPHVEFLIIEAVLEHPEKTLSEIVHDVYAQT